MVARIMVIFAVDPGPGELRPPQVGSFRLDVDRSAPVRSAPLLAESNSTPGQVHSPRSAPSRRAPANRPREEGAPEPLAAQIGLRHLRCVPEIGSSR